MPKFSKRRGINRKGELMEAIRDTIGKVYLNTILNAAADNGSVEVAIRAAVEDATDIAIRDTIRLAIQNENPDVLNDAIFEVIQKADYDTVKKVQKEGGFDDAMHAASDAVLNGETVREVVHNSIRRAMYSMLKELDTGEWYWGNSE